MGLPVIFYSRNDNKPVVFYNRSTDYNPNIKLLLHGDGIEGSTIHKDSSSSVHTMTSPAAGVVHVDTSEKVLGNASASSVTDVGDDLDTKDKLSDFIFGTNDFTIAMYVYPTIWYSYAGAFHTLMQLNQQNSPFAQYWVFCIANAQLRFDAVGTSLVTTGTVIPLNAWSHVAITRASGTTRMFIDGVARGLTGTPPPASIDAADPGQLVMFSRLKTIFGVPSYGETYTGRMDEVILLNGEALWTSNFTPPTTPYIDYYGLPITFYLRS